MSIKPALLKAATDQWIRWGGPSERLDSSRIGFTSARMEADDPYWRYVHEYWQAVGSGLTGKDKPAWSAAFISFCFKTAKADKAFPYSENHSLYCAKIVSGKFPGLSLEDPATTKLDQGDLLWASRSGDECRTPPATFTAAKAELDLILKKKADSFCSHCDIVVDVREGAVDVIGGNVHNAVTKTTYHLNDKGFISDGRRTFVGVVKNGL